MATVTVHINAQLNKYVNLKLKQLRQGVGQAALYLQRESQIIVPKVTGNLHGSAFTRKAPEDSKQTPAYRVGYTAAYAVYVHEVPNPPTTHGKEFNVKHADDIAAGRIDSYTGRPYQERGDNQQWKYLETPARTKRPQMLQIIRKALK